MRIDGTSELRAALEPSRSALVTVGWLSALVNVLLLGGPIYMMMIYDSVLPSHSLPTLFGLLAMVTLVYAFQGVFDFLRSRILADVAASLDERLSGRVHAMMADRALASPQAAKDAFQPMRDLEAIRTFLSGPGPGALIDLPWLVLFLGLLTMLHVWLGVTALAGALVLVGLTVLTDRLTRGPTEEVGTARGQRDRVVSDNLRQAEIIRALGMGVHMDARWREANTRFNGVQDRLAGVASALGGVSRIFRVFLQSVVLTVGALLYLAGEASGGIIFAASILSARALAPIDQAIANWRGFTAARQGWERLDAGLGEDAKRPSPATLLPAPIADLRVEALSVGAPGTDTSVIEDIGFALQSGDALGIIGPSAAGKTTLARALVGLWPPQAGSVRLDGAKLDQWSPLEIGRSLGYLPQHVELFEGTIAENIARMDPAPVSQAVIAAADAAGVHDMIVGLEAGYDTVLGSGGAPLSSGQRQRIGLARALYGDPFLVVLDEPNANLDAQGEAALDEAVAGLRARGAIVALIAHRPNALRQVNKVLVLQGGRMAGFGDRDEILKRLVVPFTTPASANGATVGSGEQAT